VLLIKSTQGLIPRDEIGGNGKMIRIENIEMVGQPQGREPVPIREK
jgi:hypothetical protein